MSHLDITNGKVMTEKAFKQGFAVNGCVEGEKNAVAEDFANNKLILDW